MAAAMRGVGAILLVLTLTACAAVYRNHGYVPSDQSMATLQVGRDTREEVAQAVGRPTSTGILDTGGWYYVESRFRHRGYAAPEEIDREVVAISFTDGGVLRNIERFGLEDGRVVRLSRRTTDGGTQEIGFLRQLFGNVGNLNAADFVD
ncbi:Beta-barrel assembly machine subunit BamE [Palleronia aestuarii]|uniref:Beta-barrel assembly machine subunit BamE n=1 Tax=Palleronia aestuarii TaxID=568105 RepID=A0A2W7ND56_9RHOB|nr:outer membrane protein assembly factor BamE [Palleronia aestuarii]PZX17553.1 Beta-barrel assembly machine subunit BamE [Palleronia aestuarii]